MNRILIALVLICICLPALAQESSKKKSKKEEAATKEKSKSVKEKKVKEEKPKVEKVKVVKTPVDWTKVDLSKRTADHFMIQFGSAGWSGGPDTFRTKGFSRNFNMSLLLDFPFKTNPKISVALGPGISSDNIFFDKTNIDIRNRQQVFFNKDTINKYRKYKLNTIFLEVPVEIRYSTNPGNMNKGLKFALGLKVGTLLESKTKSKVDLDATGGGGYIAKVKDKSFFNGTRIAGSFRVGIGNISMYATYSLTELFKEGLGPVGIRPYTVGITLSGL